jgi:hypothetical protein
VIKKNRGVCKILDSEVFIIDCVTHAVTNTHTQIEKIVFYIDKKNIKALSFVPNKCCFRSTFAKNKNKRFICRNAYIFEQVKRVLLACSLFMS